MSIKTFKPHFHPDDFNGPHAQHCIAREDLFQQLVGSLLREQFGPRVHVSPTKGQDGSIDIFVDAGDDINETFLGLPFPLIVECKDHDDTLGNVKNNAQAGWKKVQEKLIKKASKDWQGTFRPWKQARGYLYCISAVLPHPQARIEIGKAVADFFSNLPVIQKPSIEKTYLLDWSNLHPILNEQPRLIDSWLGIGNDGIIGHEAYVAGLTGFREYLKEEKLSYIFPNIDDHNHPGKLLDMLTQQAGTKGVMLVGTGGVGKTRTCFEVAKLAHQLGWRVLHIIPGEPAVTVQEIEKAVFPGDTRTLLVFDYLEQLRGIDWGTIRHRFLPDARQRLVPIALLANARPGILLRDENRERDSIFHIIEFVITDRKERILSHLQETLAPNASYLLGPKRVRELCGTRPIISMFIARELERYATEGRLDDSVAAQLRGDDLHVWINKRFQEDGLTPKITEELLPPTPGHIMIAAAAGLAATPLSQGRMVSVLESTLRTCGDAIAEQNARLLLSSLMRSGWIEERGSDLSAPHDVIADELLELTLCDRSWQTIRPGLAEKVFVTGISSPRVLGRFSVSLDRILGQIEFPEKLREQLKKSLTDWLERHASELGKSLLQSEVNEVSYALGAVVTGFAWHDTIFRQWETLIAPWLARNSRNADARHLLYRGLKGLPAGEAENLTASAIEWLDIHCLVRDATYILAPLLGRPDLSKELADKAVTFTLAWLETHGKTIEAQFVLPSLLGRPDLSKELADKAVTFALAWLETHGKTIEAQFVLHSLLGRPDLSKELADKAVTFALAWLETHGKTIEAGFVLPSLLGRPDLSKELADKAVTFALAWLGKHYETRDAEFVLKYLLGKSNLSETQKTQCINFAIQRLEKVYLSSEASFLLRHCLKEKTLTGKERAKVIAYSVLWLRAHAKTRDIDFVFKRLLRNPMVVDAIWREVATIALEWLKRTPLSGDRDHALNSFTERLKLLTTDEMEYLKTEVEKWLKAFPTAKDKDKERLQVCLNRLKAGKNTQI